MILNRNDAGLAAAELALAVERHVLESGSIDSVGTVGKLYYSRCCFTPWLVFSNFGISYKSRTPFFLFKGILDLHPGAINSIPSKSHLEIGTLAYEIIVLCAPNFYILVTMKLTSSLVV